MKELDNPFFIDDEFYSSFENYIEHLLNVDLELWPENETVTAFTCNLEPLNDQSKDTIVSKILDMLIDDLGDRIPEDSDRCISIMKEALIQSFDYEKFMDIGPKLWYADNGKKITITAADVNPRLQENI